MEQQAFMALVDTHLQRLKTSLPVPADGVDNRAQVLRVRLQDEHLRLHQRHVVASSACNQPLGTIWAEYKDDHPTMWLLARGLATIFPGDAEVERAFAELKYRFSQHRRTISMLALAGEMCCKQMRRLRELTAKLFTKRGPQEGAAGRGPEEGAAGGGPEEGAAGGGPEEGA
eukprot:GHVU01138869.1.p1 GENE.GHVU01138869.1~~GHVU01138869.1.p1  ORF type:complete len:172 (+),score=27.65 GHVU01138869.1:1215-1730(+)